MGNPLASFFASPRARAVTALLIVTGVSASVIAVVGRDAQWVTPVQTLLLLVFGVGTLLIYTPSHEYPRALALAAPAVGAVILGLTVLSQYFVLTLGAAAGWLIAGLLLFRPQTPRDVTLAIRKMRKGEYKEAVEHIDEMIKRDKDNPEHYRLRAMILRLDGHLGRARRDYEAMLKLAPEGDAGDAFRAEAYDGLAEVHVQAGRFGDADAAAQQAHALYPDNWVPLYNLGLINDRLNRPDKVQEHLTRALELRIPDDRQRLLAYLYLARAHARSGDPSGAAAQADKMMSMWKGLEGLQKLVGDEQGAPLAAVIADDVETARALMVEDITAQDLA